MDFDGHQKSGFHSHRSNPVGESVFIQFRMSNWMSGQISIGDYNSNQENINNGSEMAIQIVQLLDQWV